MSPLQKIYYALGELAYFIAAVDGKVSDEEKNRLHAIVVKEIKKHNTNFEYSDIIFNVLKEEKINLNLAYDFAINELKSASGFITLDIKNQIIDVLTEVSKAYEDASVIEKDSIKKIDAFLKTLN